MPGSPLKRSARPFPPHHPHITTSLCDIVAEEPITLERILQAYREESQRRALSPLEADFWERVQALVTGLRDDLEAESAQDPNSAKAALLRDELKKVLKRRDQIYQYRERKQALLAASAASGAQVDTSPLTSVERQAFQATVEVFQAGRERAFGGTPRETPGTEAAAQRAEPPAKGTKTAPSSEKSPKAAANPAPKPRPKATKPLVLVRILEDVPPFLGVDATYRLQKEDVISLPPEVAQILLDQGKAREIRPGARVSEP